MQTRTELRSEYAMQFMKLKVSSKFYKTRPLTYGVMNTSCELFAPPLTTFGTSQYSGEGVELLAAGGESVQLGAHKACARCIVEQTLAVCNFFTNGQFSKKLAGQLR